MIEDIKYPMGIKRGSVNRIIGKGGVGATTLSLQLANVIATTGEEVGDIRNIDLEISYSRGREKRLGISESIINNYTLHSENYLLEHIFSIIRSKATDKINNGISSVSVITVNSLYLIGKITTSKFKEYIESSKLLLDEANMIIIFTDTWRNRINKSNEVDYSSVILTTPNDLYDTNIYLDATSKTQVQVNIGHHVGSLITSVDRIFNEQDIREAII